MAVVRITLSQELLKALRSNANVNIVLDAPAKGAGARRGRKPAAGRGRKKARTSKKAGKRGGRRGSRGPRAGSLPARILEWAEGRKTSFGPGDVMKKFKLSRAHASMLLSKLANGKQPIQRSGRGVYDYAA